MTPKSSVLLVAAALLPLSANALGIRLFDQDAYATARGNAFTATADNPSAIYYNPAGITQLDGTQIRVGAYGISFNSRIDLKADGDPFDNKYDLQVVPQFFATWHPENLPLTFGLGFYAPFGLANEYSDNVPFRSLAHKGSLRYLTLNPVVAWKITDSLSVAAGPTINYAKVELEQGVFAKGDKFRFEGDDVALGFNLGVRWQPHKMHAFGASYRSATRMEFQGHSELRTDDFTVPFEVFPGFVVPVNVPGMRSRESAHTTFDFPQSVTVGYSFRPTPDWNFEVNVDWTDWDSLNTLTLKQKRSANVALPFNWESSFIYEFGVTRRFGTYHVSAGYLYSENSVPNESFNPSVPDSNRHVFSVGFGRKVDRYSWDIAYQYAYGPRRTIDQGTAADGTYRFESHALSISLGYNF
ncbi:OmpP1/FadL family transporter [Verrucomicrobiota bacterium sgz303538]